MTSPGEYKTVQARILKYAGEIGWTVVSQNEAKQRRVLISNTSLNNRAKGASLFFDELLDASAFREL